MRQDSNQTDFLYERTQADFLSLFLLFITPNAVNKSSTTFSICSFQQEDLKIDKTASIFMVFDKIGLIYLL
jgi:hypothetical protein